MSAVQVCPIAGARRRTRAYWELTKPSIVMLVLVTGLPAMAMAGAEGSPRVLFGGLAGTALAAAGAGALNHWYDRDLDARMERTRERPLPQGRVTPREALMLALGLGVASVVLLLATTTGLAAAIAALSFLWYGVLYTMGLKRRTPHNIVIGGAAGASAPLIGWAAATGHLALPAWLMAGVVFLWTPAHFWALALYREDDYRAVGVPMWPVVHGARSTRVAIAIYTALTLLCSAALALAGRCGPVYALSALGLGGFFAARVWRLCAEPGDAAARRAFGASILYLLALFVALFADILLRGP